MKISKELKGQIDRLSKTGAFGLSMNQKRELKRLVKEIGAPELTNLSCGVCLRNAMHNVNNFLVQKGTVPVLQMSMDKKPEEMTFNELRKEAKRRNLKFKNPNKKQLIEALKK